MNLHDYYYAIEWTGTYYFLFRNLLGLSWFVMGYEVIHFKLNSSTGCCQWIKVSLNHMAVGLSMTEQALTLSPSRRWFKTGLLGLCGGAHFAFNVPLLPVCKTFVCISVPQSRNLDSQSSSCAVVSCNVAKFVSEIQSCLVIIEYCCEILIEYISFPTKPSEKTVC